MRFKAKNNQFNGVQLKVPPPSRAQHVNSRVIAKSNIKEQMRALRTHLRCKNSEKVRQSCRFVRSGMLISDEEVVDCLYEERVSEEADDEVTERNSGRFVARSIGRPGYDVGAHVLLRFLLCETRGVLAYHVCLCVLWGGRGM